MSENRTPIPDDLPALIGPARLAAWRALCAEIDRLYDMERLWGNGGKKWTHEYKYRRGGKTLCALYARPDCAGFLLIFGQAERDRFEAARASFSPAVCRIYDEATTYHDGKWILFPLDAEAPLAEYVRLLAIKRRPNQTKEAPLCPNKS